MEYRKGWVNEKIEVFYSGFILKERKIKGSLKGCIKGRMYGKPSNGWTTKKMK